jgi:flagellar hook-associated protein 2
MGLRVGGLASGLDTAALIDATLALERRPLLMAEARKATIEREKTLFQELGTLLSDLRDASAAIDNLSSGQSGPAASEEFLSYVASSSDSAVLDAVASSGASPGSVDITVSQLATSALHVSTAFTDTTTIIASAGQSISIAHGGATPINISVGAGGASLSDLRDLINTDVNNGGEVRADLIFDGVAHRLVLTGTDSGAANDVAFITTIPGESGGTFLDTPLSVPAADAQLEVFGVAVTRGSNSITDVVPGVTLELKSALPGIPVTVQVSRDDDEIETRTQAFVDAYNAIVDFFETNARYDAGAEQAGALVGDSTIRGIENQVRRVMVDRYSFVGNPLGSLSEVGMSVDPDGRLTLDSDKFRASLATDANAVRELLSGDGVTKGAAASVAELIDPIIDPDKTIGVIAIRDDGFDDKISAFDRQIERLEIRLAKREELLVLKYSQLETVLARLQAQGSALDGLSSLLTSLNER